MKQMVEAASQLPRSQQQKLATVLEASLTSMSAADPAYLGWFTAQHINDFVQCQQTVMDAVGMNH